MKIEMAMEMKVKMKKKLTVSSVLYANQSSNGGIFSSQTLLTKRTALAVTNIILNGFMC